MDILPFHQNNICPKCGSTSIVRSYVKETIPDMRIYPLAMHDPATLVHVESLICICAACGYQWREHTKDYVAPGTPDQETTRLDGDNAEHPTVRLDPLKYPINQRF